jgi:metallo-beta-lactamase class B
MPGESDFALPSPVLLGLILVMFPLGMRAQTQQPAPKPDSAEVQAHVAEARKIAGTMWAKEADILCEERQISNAADPGPAKLFDNLYAIPGQYGGANGVVYVIPTSAGLMMIDSGWRKDTETVLLPGLKTLGLKPEDVKLVIVTHGHPDHYGGAAYLQDQYGAHVVLSAADWDFMMASPPPDPPSVPPKKDMIAIEGQAITLGDESVTPVFIPGHTPGSLGLIFPVKEGGRTHMVGILGGGFRAQGPDTQVQQFLNSVDHFKDWTKKMKVDVELQNHPIMDSFGDKLAALKARKPGDPNPFVVGQENYTKFLDVLSECTKAQQARRAK